jgi:hypothetical protein
MDFDLENDGQTVRHPRPHSQKMQRTLAQSLKSSDQQAILNEI